MINPTKEYLVKQNTPVKLKKQQTKESDGYKGKEDAKKALQENILELRDMQRTLYAADSHSVLLIFQAMDAGGKDSTIKHVMSGINPQGCVVHSFKHPSNIELDHNFLWRHQMALPRRGMIGIFNRSHYENVLISKVHPELVLNERIPQVASTKDLTKEFWEERYKQIRRFEKTTAESGTLVLKFFLNISKEEQKNRFLERLNNPEKHWKFDKSDIEERQHWDEYQKAYESAIEKTSTDYAPWYVIPADNKWYARLCIGKIVHAKLQELKLKMPLISEKHITLMKEAKKALDMEK
jgi:PPK2 family polyphosphate:nucleotide phosphotransferase